VRGKTLCDASLPSPMAVCERPLQSQMKVRKLQWFRKQPAPNQKRSRASNRG
jgi:hypothetical protein